MKLFSLAAVLGFSLSLSGAAGQSCSSLYGQCGGINWTGATCCASGSVCTAYNSYYSQCVVGTLAHKHNSGRIYEDDNHGSSDNEGHTDYHKHYNNYHYYHYQHYCGEINHDRTDHRNNEGDNCNILNHNIDHICGRNWWALVLEEFNMLANHSGFDLIRTWGFCEISTCPGGQVLSFSGTTLTINSNATFFTNIDYTLSLAAKQGIKIILVLTNNWSDFGGMDVYTKAFGGTYHDTFYTDANVKAAFKQYISYLLNRVNTITGVAYKDDPTIFGWEIANEARCAGSSTSASSTCTSATITAWYDEISKYIKTIDTKHMVGTGDEGFGVASVPNSHSDNTYAYIYVTSSGLNFTANLALSAIDFGTAHLYPGSWGLSNATLDGNDWINAHAVAAKSVGKPWLLEEFGITDKTSRASVYGAWYTTGIAAGIGGMSFWTAAGPSYSDYDGYTLYSADITTLIDPESALIAKLNSC
ncbi:hypothetical protein HDU82_004501 [Entophlyctis luteolus]|nr:hypothetical protein HDU82_004501 [Entophlyctis luteolus]